MKYAAKFSPDHMYRWWLTRVWDVGKPQICWIMLNPSTADERYDDPTLRRIIEFSQAWDYGRLVVVNLYPYCSSTPEEVRGWVIAGVFRAWERNKHEILETAMVSQRVVCAWGAAPWAQVRGFFTVKLLEEKGIELACLGLTQSGAPKHPLARGRHRIPNDRQLIRYEAP